MSFGVLVLLVGLVSGASLNVFPSSLDYDLEVGEEECLRFGIQSGSYDEALVSTLDGDFSGVDVSYSPEGIEDFGGYESVEVCVSASEVGSWIGDLKFETVTETSYNVGVGVRLNIGVRQIVGFESEDGVDDSGNVVVEVGEGDVEDLGDVGITGGVVGSRGGSLIFVGVVFLVLVLGLVLIFF